MIPTTMRGKDTLPSDHLCELWNCFIEKYLFFFKSNIDINVVLSAITCKPPFHCLYRWSIIQHNFIFPKKIKCVIGHIPTLTQKSYLWVWRCVRHKIFVQISFKTFLSTQCKSITMLTFIKLSLNPVYLCKSMDLLWIS